ATRGALFKPQEPESCGNTTAISEAGNECCPLSETHLELHQGLRLVLPVAIEFSLARAPKDMDRDGLQVVDVRSEKPGSGSSVPPFGGSDQKPGLVYLVALPVDPNFGCFGATHLSSLPRWWLERRGRSWSRWRAWQRVERRSCPP